MLAHGPASRFRVACPQEANNRAMFVEGCLGTMRRIGAEQMPPEAHCMAQVVLEVLQDLNEARIAGGTRDGGMEAMVEVMRRFAAHLGQLEALKHLADLFEILRAAPLCRQVRALGFDYPPQLQAFEKVSHCLAAARERYGGHRPGVGAYEAARAPNRIEETLFAKPGERLAHDRARDAERASELQFRGQLGARRKLAAHDRVKEALVHLFGEAPRPNGLKLEGGGHSVPGSPRRREVNILDNFTCRIQTPLQFDAQMPGQSFGTCKPSFRGSYRRMALKSFSVSSAPAWSRALSIADLREMARRRLPRSVFEFIDGGAEDELTLADNRAAFERRRIVPRVLVDVSAAVLETEILGRPASSPFVISPMGSCVLSWPDADIAIARAASAFGIPYTLSTMATISIERMAQAVQGRLWFQLYVLRNRELTDRLVDRARAADYEALVVTLDLPAGGKRERDLRNGLSIPLRFSVRHVYEGMMRPHWTLRMLRGGLPEFENVRGLMDEKTAGLTIAAMVGQNLDASYGWDDLRRLRDRWPRKLLVKGVEHPEDARRLLELGVDGIWVSNHGGRQLDGAVASADALPHVAAAVGGKVPLLIDSGVRRGVDTLKALALGAQATAIGRAALFGAAVGGEAGVRRALEILTGELALAMKLSGVPTVQSVDASILSYDQARQGD
jgi:isopentenyl diphosphate isomerase/L-lactate dehydrogenase-like FMN-dependent dehydrogenase